MIRSALLFCLFSLVYVLPVYAGDKLMLAAASDLRYALDEVILLFRQQHPTTDIHVVYGSSGKLSTQIRHGAPFDLFFSADSRFPELLYQDGHAVTVPQPYAVGHLVLWSPRQNMSEVELHQLKNMTFRRLAIAQPAHAPYGQRAKEALQTLGLWAELEPKLVYGENIAQTAQLVQSGGADIGIIALSLAKFPELAKQGYHLIPTDLHQPLTQAFVVTRHGADNLAAHHFSAFMKNPAALTVMQRFGFELPATLPAQD
ncbi:MULTISPECIES: molybdate ABC transporter substrate-binding protein [unclassified Arsukibacterium]|uniref:molybdate ABC transporter substrate-binding protein n=1 Tax=unclassified Arsukibacterium TaxID=2635278 RepID=UPI000C909F84|nr:MULTISPECIES: molybdate ABC transporter substrate-binding protein [unclassified Arsukibacterium]MAA94346.1 molybdate ABC transporter substrate-binding protein [Rheinheimera sp.]MDX1538873.1 molybdate ABC transporter substrate-binding protein [Arsukibacterium sp.]|tara:strand:- start:10222 stop:10995 length:774 start_codon:yes stop_codon:yes gene_type:complete